MLRCPTAGGGSQAEQAVVARGKTLHSSVRVDNPQISDDAGAKGPLLFLQETFVGDLPLGYKLEEVADTIARDTVGSLEIAKRLVPLYLRSLTLKQADYLEVQNEVVVRAKVFGRGWKPMMEAMEVAKNVPKKRAIELILFAREHRKNELKTDQELEEFESRLLDCCVDKLDASELAKLEKTSGSATARQKQLAGLSGQQAAPEDNPEGGFGEHTQF